jgi:hypothetical protein
MGCLAPVAGDVERGNCCCGDQQQAGQRRGRWQGHKMHHCLWCSRRRQARFAWMGQGREPSSFRPSLYGLQSMFAAIAGFRFLQTNGL